MATTCIYHRTDEERAYSEGYEAIMVASNKLSSGGSTGPISNPYAAGSEASNAWEAGSNAAIADLDHLS